VTYDADAPCTQRVIQKLEDPRVYTNLLGIAGWFAPSAADREDLLADALVLVCDPDKAPWDPTKGTLYQHMGFVMRDLWVRKLSSWTSHHIVFDSNLAADEASVDRAPLPDEALEQQRALAWLRRLGAMLRERVLQHDHAVRVLDLASEGIDEPSELAEKVPCAVEQVYRAIETLKYHARAVLAEDRRAAALRMAEARRQSA
jgi:hypothetical protein